MSKKSSTFALEIGKTLIIDHSAGETDGATLGSDLEGLAGSKTHTASARGKRESVLPISGAFSFAFS